MLSQSLVLTLSGTDTFFLFLNILWEELENPSLWSRYSLNMGFKYSKMSRWAWIRLSSKRRYASLGNYFSGSSSVHPGNENTWKFRITWMKFCFSFLLSSLAPFFSFQRSPICSGSYSVTIETSLLILLVLDWTWKAWGGISIAKIKILFTFKLEICSYLGRIRFTWSSWMITSSNCSYWTSYEVAMYFRSVFICSRLLNLKESCTHFLEVSYGTQ